MPEAAGIGRGSAADGVTLVGVGTTKVTAAQSTSAGA
jgi:hypothetical protein